MKYIRYALIAFVLILAVTIALANRQLVSLSLWPDAVSAVLGFGRAFSAPLFIIVGGAFGAGLVVGLAWEWLRERPVRVEARQTRHELNRLRNEHGIEPERKSGNPAREQVLSILEGTESSGTDKAA